MTKEATLHVGVLETTVGYRLQRAANAVRQDFHRTVGSTGLRPTLFCILSVIAANPGINPAVVSGLLDIKRANMANFIAELAGKGWISRAPDPRDGRAISLSLTKVGEAIMAEAEEYIRQHEARILSRLTAAERGKLCKLLDRILP